jgi:hypothetical protein
LLGARVQVDEGLAGRGADTNGQSERRIFGVQLRNCVADRECGANGALGVILVGGRRSEDRDDSVPDELLHGAAEALELGLRPCVVRREEATNVLWVEALGAFREVDEVDEDCGDDLALLCGHALLLFEGGSAGRAVGELRGDDGAA